MNIYAWKSFSKKVNSTKTPKASAAITVGNVFLKDGTSIMNPTLVLRRNSHINRQINYVQLLNHYYYVTDIRFVDGSNVEISCEVDPLATWKENLLGCECYVERTNDEDMINGNITDVMFPNNATKLMQQSDGYYYVNPYCSYSFADENTLYCVGFSVPVWSLIDGGALDSINAIAKGTSSFVLMTAFQMSELWSAATTLISVDFNPFDYIISCVALPTQPLITQDQMVTKAGWIKYGPEIEDRINFKFKSRRYLNEDYLCDSMGVMSWFEVNSFNGVPGALNITVPSRPGDTYLDRAPYKSYTLYAGVFGTITLPADVNYINGITLRILTDVTDGSAMLYVYGGGVLLGKYTGNIGHKVSLQKLYGEGLSDRISNITKGITAGTTLISSVATGNVIGVVSGAAGLADTMSSVYQAGIPTQHGIGCSDSNALSISDASFWLVTEYTGAVYTYGVDVLGKPCCRYAALGDFALGSLVIVKNPSVNIAGAYKPEIDTINQYLVSGVYLD